MKFILLNKYLVKELAANVQIGKVVRVSRVNDLNRFAIVFKPPLGNLAKKYPDCATLLEPSNNYRLFLSTNSLDDVSKADNPSCCKSLYLDISNIPLRVAIPKSDMKPIIAGMLITPPVRKIVNTPPINANGRFSKITADCVTLLN
jgi:hypothetical protein